MDSTQELIDFADRMRDILAQELAPVIASIQDVETAKDYNLKSEIIDYYESIQNAHTLIFVKYLQNLLQDEFPNKTPLEVIRLTRQYNNYLETEQRHMNDLKSLLPDRDLKDLEICSQLRAKAENAEKYFQDRNRTSDQD